MRIRVPSCKAEDSGVCALERRDEQRIAHHVQEATDMIGIGEIEIAELHLKAQAKRG